MEFAFDRYLDDGRDLHLTISLRSRTTEMHSALTALEPAERQAVATALTAALDAVAGILHGRTTPGAR
jgi:hypothetical protein